MQNPMILVFGGTGDLAKKKVMPALFALYKNKKLVDTPIIAIGRRALTREQYEEEMQLRELEKQDKATFHTFMSNLSYQAVDFKDTHPIAFINAIEHINKKYRCEGHVIAYLATSYELFTSILAFLDTCHLLDAKKTIIACEKPFGFDNASARKLQKALEKHVPEKNIYRIDHYLGKDMTNNLLPLRANPLFARIWNAQAIDNVQIVAAENFGSEGRGEYYDKAGAIRDFVQNHLLQLLALTAMELPTQFEAGAIQNAKRAVFKKLHVPTPKEIVRGQYDQYTADATIPPNSKTETFIAFKTYVQTLRWKNVPFYIKTGKYLNKKCSEIHLVLKKDAHQKQNVITIRIGPDQEGIALHAHLKDLTSAQKEKPITLNYRLEETHEAYEHIFSALLTQNHTLFPRWDEVEASWKFTDALSKNAGKTQLHIYKRNIADLEASRDLLKRDNREWVFTERKITI